MFTQSTVFVLGAGVSQPFGFPSGVGLIDAICRHNGDREKKLIALLIRADEGRSESFVKEFFEALRDSGLNSIDAWLEGNPKYRTLGKCAIAAIIWEVEHQAVIKAVEDSNNWFRWLWNRMYHPDIKKIGDNPVHFITFNYDRLLEYKLYQHIEGTYRERSDKEREDAFTAMLGKIIHVHGALQNSDNYYGNVGRFWKGHMSLTDRTQPESVDRLGKGIAHLASTINIVCETPGSQDLVTTAQQWLLHNEKRVFLGFGYDKRNLDRLGIHQLTVSSDIPYARGSEYDIVTHPLVGTAFNMELGEQLSAKQVCGGKIHFGENSYNAVRFCRKYVKA